MLTVIDAALVLVPCAWIALRNDGDARLLACIVAAAFLSHQLWFRLDMGAGSLLLGCLGDAVAAALTLAVSRAPAARAVAALYIPPVFMYTAVMAGALDYAVMAAWVVAMLVLQTLIIGGGAIHGKRNRLAASLGRSADRPAVAVARNSDGSKGR